MRGKLSSEMLKQCVSDPKFVLITGDLGYKLLEPAQEALKDRFINAGVSEQNMISVAAAFAKEGLKPWVYSIAPFCFARPFEQIRNDICLHNLPVVLMGNGGGFGYGVMGPTHHAIEDYGVMLALQNMQVLVPAFADDISVVIKTGLETTSPTYIRLGADEKPADYIPPLILPGEL
jgi:transketolase